MRSIDRGVKRKVADGCCNPQLVGLTNEYLVCPKLCRPLTLSKSSRDDNFLMRPVNNAEQTLVRQLGAAKSGARLARYSIGDSLSRKLEVRNSIETTEICSGIVGGTELSVVWGRFVFRSYSCARVVFNTLWRCVSCCYGLQFLVTEVVCDLCRSHVLAKRQ